MSATPATTNLEFKPLSASERDALVRALKANHGQEKALTMGRDTSFAGSSDLDEVTDAETITAIKSVPVHY